MSLSGPIFDKSSEVIVKDYIRAVELAVAEKLKKVFISNLQLTLKRPTGNYVSKVRVQVNNFGTQLDDNKVVYGPWLEGISSRNRSTRFKGYANLKKTRQSVNPVTEAEKVLPNFLRRMQ